MGNGALTGSRMDAGMSESEFSHRSSVGESFLGEGFIKSEAIRKPERKVKSTRLV